MTAGGGGLRWKRLQLVRPRGKALDQALATGGCFVAGMGAAIAALCHFPQSDAPGLVDRLLRRPGGVVVLLIYMGMAGPFLEEVIFRGWATRVISALRGPRTAVIVTTLLWAGIHLSWSQLPVHPLMGFALQMVRVRTGSLWFCVLLHSLHNLAAISAEAALPNDWLVQATAASAAPWYLLAATVGSVVCVSAILRVPTALQDASMRQVGPAPVRA